MRHDVRLLEEDVGEGLLPFANRRRRRNTAILELFGRRASRHTVIELLEGTGGRCAPLAQYLLRTTRRRYGVGSDAPYGRNPSRTRYL